LRGPAMVLAPPMTRGDSWMMTAHLVEKSCPIMAGRYH
jgi:hypothetical protein